MEANKRKAWLGGYAQLLVPLLSIALIMLFNVFRDPSFFTITLTTNNLGNTVLSGNLIGILNGASELAIIAMGMTLVTAACGGQDISVGALATIAASVFVKILKSMHGGQVAIDSILLGFLACCLVAIVFGAFNGTLVSVFKIQPMIATLVLFTCGRSIAYWINGGASPTVESPLIAAIGSFIPGCPIPTPILIVAVMGILMALLFRFTTLGLYTQSVGINQRAARLNGINPMLIKLISFMVLGVCCAVAGCITTGRLGLVNHEQMLLEIEMDAILAVAIGGNVLGGGKFKVSGSVLGAYAIQALTTTLYAMKVPSTDVKAYKAIVIILIVIISSPVVKSSLKRLKTDFVPFLRRMAQKVKDGLDEWLRSRRRWRREPLSDSLLLVVITITVFTIMYATAMILAKAGVFGVGFLRWQRVFDMLNDNAALIIVSCGLTIVMIGGGIDISVGGVMALVAMACTLLLNAGATIFDAALLAIGIGLAFGIVQGWLIAYLKIQPFIITLAGMFFARGMITILSSKPVKVAHEGFKALKAFRVQIPSLGYIVEKTGKLIPAKMEIGVIVALAVLLIIFIMLRKTRPGRSIYALGGNNQSAMMLGVNVEKTRFMTYVISGLLAGIGGFVLLMHVGAGNATNAAGAEMKAIASSIIGGTLLSGGVGNVAGTLFGVMSLATIDAIVTTAGLKGAWWQEITVGAMLCFFIILQSVVLTLRGKNGFKLMIPAWLMPKGKPQDKPTGSVAADE